MKAMTRNRPYSAFTIVELIVVIAVIAILAAITIVSYGAWKTTTATASVKSDLVNAASAMESGRTFGTGYPSSIPSSFSASSSNTVTLTSNTTTTYCIDGSTSFSGSIQYYIDNLTQANGPTVGTCAGRTNLPLPSAPTGVVATAPTSTSVQLTWIASSYAATYTAVCATDNAFIVGSIKSTVTATSTTLTPFTSNTLVYCRVNAGNGAGTSAWSGTITTTTPVPGYSVVTFAGSGAFGSANGIGTAASFIGPTGIVIDSVGNIYVADTNNNLIRKITPGAVVTTFAGSGASGSVNGTGTAASFNSPNGMTIDSAGNLYVADASNNLIRKITPGAVVTTFAGSGAYGYVDGTSTAASFKRPYGIATDTSGNIYVADTSNNLIRKITPGAVVTTLAGSTTFGSANGTGTAARFRTPYGIATDTSGNIYVGDTSNSLIREITPGGVVTTLAGSGAYGYVDGTSTAASFRSPSKIVIDGAGNLYVADTHNNMIRKIQYNP